MKFPIGFALEDMPPKAEMERLTQQNVAPVKSLVQVYFPDRNQSLTYFNDQFDLNVGDFVFVEGKLEGIGGIVREVCKRFKIKVADYKKVVGVADTDVSGQLLIADSHFVSFDPTVLPYEKIRSWYLPPVKAEDEFETGNDNTGFSLDTLSEMNASPAIFERGHNYYLEDRVVYLSMDNGRGRAIVEGEHTYEVEFDYDHREIRNLLCSCPCGCTCKHEVATMLQLKDILETLESSYKDSFRNYFAAVEKQALFRFVVRFKNTGSLTL